MRRILPNLLFAGLLALGGCAYKISIQQGNYLDDTTVQRVETGMTRDQVRILLGTPMADDPFSEDRWDYIYYFSNGRTGQVVNKRVTVHFDGNTVARIDKDDS